MSHNHFLLVFFGERILVMLGLLFLIYRYIKKGFFKVDAEGQIYDCKLKDIIQSHKEILTVILKVVILVLMLYYVVGIYIPCFKDLPYVYRGEYPHIEGTVIKDPNIDSSNKIELYNVTIRDAKTGENLRVSLYGKNGIWTGDEIKAEYLPNSELGILLEKNGEQVRGKKENKETGKEQEEDKGNEKTVLQRILIVIISCALFSAFMQLGAKIRVGKNDVKSSVSGEIVVRINNSFSHFLIVYNIILIPVGILAFLAMLAYIGSKDKENVMYTAVTFGCSIIAFVLWRYMQNKKIRITESGIWVKIWFRKEKFYSRRKIKYRLPTENKIRLLLGPSRRKIAITRLYNNFDIFVDWLELNCKKLDKK